MAEAVMARGVTQEGIISDIAARKEEGSGLSVLRAPRARRISANWRRQDCVLGLTRVRRSSVSGIDRRNRTPGPGPELGQADPGKFAHARARIVERLDQQAEGPVNFPGRDLMPQG